MRIGINGAFWQQETTGSGQYARSLVGALATQAPGNEYCVYLPQPIDAQPSASWTYAPLAGFWQRAPENVAKVWFEQAALPAACRRDGVDLLHIPYWAPVRWPGRLPTVVTIHDLIPLILPAYRGNRLVRAYTRLVCAAARRARRVLTDSAASARDIERLLRVPAERVRVVHLAADARYAPPPADEVERVRAALRLPERYLLYLGGFDRRKNVPESLAAYAQALPELGDIPLVVAGRLPARDTAFTPDPRRIARELAIEPWVQFTGWVAEEDKPGLYAGAEVFLFPSRYEGFGLPVLEAISCGTPAIVASGSSLEEVGGAASLTVPPNDVSALARALARWADDADLRAQLRAACAPQATRFSTSEMAQRTLAAYAEALG